MDKDKTMLSLNGIDVVLMEIVVEKYKCFPKKENIGLTKSNHLLMKSHRIPGTCIYMYNHITDCAWILTLPENF